MKDYVNVKKPSKKLPTKGDKIWMAIGIPAFFVLVYVMGYVGV